MKKKNKHFTWLLFTLVVVLEKSFIQGKIMARLALKKEPEDLLFLNTMPSKLKCHADGYPKPQISWLDEKGSTVQPINGIRYVSGGDLHFNAFEANQYMASAHRTKYRCNISSEVGAIVSKEIRVRAVIDERYSPVVYHQSAPLEGYAIFICHLPSDSADYIKVLAWLVTYPGGAKKRTILSGMSIDGFTALTNGDMVVDDVLKIHEEFKFSCISQNILNNVTLTSSQGRIFSNEPTPFSPINFIRPQNQTIYAGETLTLNCHASSYPLPTFVWYKNGVTLDLKDPVKIITGGSIKIIRSTVQDQGKYTCKIIYEENETTFDVTVFIKVPLAMTEVPKLVSTLSKKTVTFSCEGTGTKPMTIEWRKNGAVLRTGNHVSVHTNRLMIFDVTTKDEGVYQCIISNNFEQVQASTRLIVNAVLPAIISLTASQTVQARSLVTLTCQCKGQPFPKFTWLKDGKPVEVEKDGLSVSERKGANNIVVFLLNIRNVQTKFSATYTCVAENRVGRESAETLLRVEGPPKIIEFTQNVYGITGHTLSIDCKGKGFPQVTHEWFKNGIEIYANDRISLHTNGSLQIRRFSASDEGTYWCVVKNKHGKHQDIVKVAVLDPPQIRPFSLTPELVGKRAQYLCTAQGSNVGLQISWYKNGLEAKKIKGVKIMDLSISKALTFEHIMTSHRGRYTCVVENKAGKASYSADLVVYEKPVFYMKPTDTTVLDAHPVQLFCSATGFPFPQITWFRRTINGALHPINLDHRVQQLHNGSLIISAAQASDNGRYVCQASFFNRKMVPDPLVKEIRLVVRVPARITVTSPLVARGLKSTSVDLFCSTSGTPVLKLKWFKNGLIISTENHLKYFSYQSQGHETQPPTLNSSLEIRNLIQTDTGNYECMATNAYGSQNTRFEVYVEEKPYKPSAVEQISSTSRSMQIKWEPGFDGNSRINQSRVEVKKVWEDWSMASIYRINGSTTNYLVPNLHPGDTYTVRVKSMNKHGISDWSQETRLSTKEEAPSAPPTHVSINALARDQLSMKWEAPEASKRNGILTNYRIFYASPNLNHDFSLLNLTVGNTKSYVLTNLLPYTVYRIQVQALTKAGGGPLSLVKYGKTLEGVPSLPPPAVNVQTISSQHILVRWQRVPSNTVNGVLKGYKVIYTDMERKKTFENDVKNTLQAHLTGLDKFTMYTIGVLAYTSTGNGVMSDPMYKRTDQDVPEEPAQFTVIPAGPTKLVISWSPPLHANGILTAYVLYYNDIQVEDAVAKTIIPNENVNFVLRDLTLGKKYRIWLTAKTIKGEGKSTMKVVAQTTKRAPAKIITHRYVMYRPIGSDVTLSCTAVGYPKPSISWHKVNQSSSYHKQRRWLATDSPRRLFNIQMKDSGIYNCTAMNLYGSDWNIVTLVVQVVPSAPDNVTVKLIKQYQINVSWTPGNDGNSVIIDHRVQYLISGKHEKWQTVIVPGRRLWFMITNVTNFVAYFRVACKNSVGVGDYYPPLKLVISGTGVNKFAGTTIFDASGKKKSNTLRYIMQPLLISVVVIATILIILLFIASWDRNERRIRKPKCYRLCFCSCRRKHDFIDDPYGEPGLPWPWNIRSNRHSGAFGMDDVLLGASDEQLEFKYAPAYSLEGNSTDSLKKKFSKASACDFEPVVLFTPSKSNNNRSYPDGTKHTKSAEDNIEHNTLNGRNDIVSNDNINKHCANRNDDYETTSIIEKYLRSQKEFEPKNSNNIHIIGNPRDSLISEDESVDVVKQPVRMRGSADGVSDKHSPPQYEDIQKQNTWNSDAPRALLRGSSPTKRGRRGRNRKSLDSLILKALEDIEEKQILANESVTDPKDLQQHAATVIKELLANPPRSYDSVSSTCSSSVGELRRAFEFGKKYGLQDYNVPPYVLDSEEEDELDFQAHEILLDKLDLANFSEMPRDLNDMMVRIPLPVRMEESLQNDSNSETEDEETTHMRREQSLV